MFFFHAVLSGLQNDNIKRDLQLYLELTNVSGVLSLEKLNIPCACKCEKQDKKKILMPARTAAIHSAQTDSTTPKNEKSIQPNHSKYWVFK